MTYHFDKEKHHHSLDGKPLYGVTTVIGKTLAKPALLPWAAGQATEYVKSHWKVSKKYTKAERDAILDMAKTAHTRKKDSGADLGTRAHDLVEQYTKHGIEYTGDDEQLKKILDTFVTWAKDSKAIFHESEKNVYSRELWIGGILDFIVEIDGKKYVGDFKTSSGIYPEYFLQCAAYDIALQEMGIDDIDGYIIVNVDKNAKLRVMERVDRVLFRQAFRDCLSLYKTMNSLDFPKY